MSTSTKESGRRQGAVRWLVLTTLVVLLFVFLPLFCLPWLVAFPSIQRWLATQASRVVAPGTVHFAQLRVSWTQPTEISGLVLRDAQGADIISTPSAHFSWNLWHMLVSGRGSATLRLERAAVDVQRSASGVVNLLETLKPILRDDPDRTILVRISDGNLRFRQEGLTEPFLADPAHIELDLNAYPQPIAWRIRLGRSGENTQPGTVQIEGSLGRQQEGKSVPPDLELSIRGKDWPWRYCSPEVEARGVFAGTVEAHQKRGALLLLGDAQLRDVEAGGNGLSGDQPRLGAVTMAWSLEHQGETWTAQRLEATSVLGTVRASGSFPPARDQGGHLEAELDLAALARQIPRTLRLHNELTVEKGAVKLRAEVTGNAEKGRQTIHATGSLTDLAAHRGGQNLTFRDPATFALQLEREPSSLRLEQFTVQTPFLTASGAGDLDQGIRVTTTVDMSKAVERLHDWVDVGDLKVTGQGTINTRYQRAANTFELTASASFKGPGAEGLPIVEAVHRDHISAQLAVRGAATASGFPTRLDDFSLTGQADTEQLTVSAQRQGTTSEITFDGRGRAQLTMSGKKQEATGSLKGRWAENDVTLDPIVLTLAPLVGPGGQFLPSDPARWSGRGKYDATRDELSIVADSGAFPSGFKDFAIAPSEIRLGGLKSRDAAWFEANLSGELADLDLGSVNLQSLNPPSPDAPDRPGPPQSPELRARESRLAGRFQSTIQARQSKQGWQLGARAEVDNLARLLEKTEPQVLAEHASASLQAKLTPALDQLALAEVALQTPYGHLDGAGLVSDLPGTPHVDIRGTLSPDWKVLANLLARKVEPKASVRGAPSAWSVNGALPRWQDERADPLATLNGELGLTLEQLDIFGMQLGKTALLIRSTQGKIQIDPIDSILNSGRLHLEPAIVTDRQNRTWLHLGPSSALLDAVVNDEVSHRVLSFAAPVLDQATRVRGRVSVAVSDAFLPLDPSSEAQAKIDGDVLFDAVEFMPGPLADQILSVFRQERRPLLTLRDPVSVRIVGRRIYQEGLVIPIGNVAAIGLEGWVDFDQNLNLNASFAPIPPRRNIPILSDILENTRIRVPITGTFQKPRLNGEAIKENFKELGVNMLDNLIGAGMGGLGRILQGGPEANRPDRDFFPPFVAPDGDQPPTPPPPRPEASSPTEGSQPGARDGANAAARPGAGANSARAGRQPLQAAGSADGNPDLPAAQPAPPTPEERGLARQERRLRRLEKRAERRMRRGLPPE